jgi:hypothetical protein
VTDDLRLERNVSKERERENNEFEPNARIRMIEKTFVACCKGLS